MEYYRRDITSVSRKPYHRIDIRFATFIWSETFHHESWCLMAIKNTSDSISRKINGIFQ